MDISQTVSNLTAGQTCLLKFDHAAPGYGVVPFDVYWNDQLVAEIDTQDTSFKTESYLLSAQDGDNVLRFVSVSEGFGGGGGFDRSSLPTASTVTDLRN